MVMENDVSSGVQKESEERAVKRRAKELFDKGVLKKCEVGTYKGLAAIHKYLYKDVTDQAGQTRTVDIVKGNMRFTPVEALNTGLEFVDIMPIETFDDIVDKYIEMNIAHPFRVGNSIALRIWLNEMLRDRLGKVVNFAAIDKDAFSSALELSPTYDAKLNKLFKGALTQDVGRETFLKGIDASFMFEGFCEVSVFDL